MLCFVGAEIGKAVYISDKDAQLVNKMYKCSPPAKAPSKDELRVTLSKLKDEPK